MISSQGASVQLPNGICVSQTIGQQSAIGNYKTSDYTVGQGFQQSQWIKHMATNSPNAITTITYPNPFVQTVNFQFSQPVQGDIAISVFDIRGRLVFQQDSKANGNVLTIDLSGLPSSDYLVKLTAKDYNYFTQILKQ